MDHELDRIERILPEIESRTSPTFCMAKWHHTTIYLYLGETHSCYHPSPHKIPLEELKNNPSALHNTMEKKLERKQMLDGLKPSGCDYCWKVEALGDSYISDRKQRSVSIYEGNPKRLDEILDNKWDFNINPEYVELSFGNTCNFKCGYCHPKFSSRYFDEIKKFGPYDKTIQSRNDVDWFENDLYLDEETNPYVTAWWQWWPELKQTLNILRLTGGEPLIHGSTYRLLDEINKSPMPNLEFNINTNLGMSEELFDKFINKIKPIIEENKVREFKLFTSLDIGLKDRAEYMRYGLDLDLFERNLDKYLSSIKNSKISLMITFNILCVTGFDSLLIKILEWRKKYNDQNSYDPSYPEHKLQRVQMDTPYLKEPSQYDMNILPKEEFMPYMDKHLQFMIDNTDDLDNMKFDRLEVAKFKRVHEYMKSTIPESNYLEVAKHDFYQFFKEYDRRKGLDFKKTFPEYENFWNECRKVRIRRG